MPIELRDVTPADFPALVDMNRSALPAVSEASLEDMAWYAKVAVYFKVAAEGDAVHGFLIAFTPEVQGYPSENFRWFQARYDDFMYIDRIVIAESARGRGLGQRFSSRSSARRRSSTHPNNLAGYRCSAGRAKPFASMIHLHRDSVEILHKDCRASTLIARGGRETCPSTNEAHTSDTRPRANGASAL